MRCSGSADELLFAAGTYAAVQSLGELAAALLASAYVFCAALVPLLGVAVVSHGNAGRAVGGRRRCPIEDKRTTIRFFCSTSRR